MLDTCITHEIDDSFKFLANPRSFAQVSNGRSPGNGGSRDVLSSLPTTRPQRRSPKRGAPGAGSAKPAGAGPTTPKRSSAKPAARSTAKAGAGPAARPAPAPGPSAKPRARRAPTAGAPEQAGRAATGSAPSQGYQPISSRGSVQPPSGGEILASAVQAAGEAAQIGLTIGERLLRAAASRLPGR